VIDELVVTDTIPLSQEAIDLGKIRQVSVASMVAETIRRINNEESISAMFDSYL
jgi:ribose-phosphate pyrophosphokinase